MEIYRRGERYHGLIDLELREPGADLVYGPLGVDQADTPLIIFTDADCAPREGFVARRRALTAVEIEVGLPEEHSGACDLEQLDIG